MKGIKVTSSPSETSIAVGSKGWHYFDQAVIIIISIIFLIGINLKQRFRKGRMSLENFDPNGHIPFLTLVFAIVLIVVLFRVYKKIAITCSNNEIIVYWNFLGLKFKKRKSLEMYKNAELHGELELLKKIRLEFKDGSSINLGTGFSTEILEELRAGIKLVISKK